MAAKAGPRTVNARRMLTLGGVAVSLAIPVAAASSTLTQAPKTTVSTAKESRAVGAPATPDLLIRVAASGGGEGEGAAQTDGYVGFLRDLAYLTGHLRVGVALEKAGDSEAAKTHMGHPIAEKYGAVADRLDELGFGRLRGDISALSAATDSGAPLEDIQGLYDTAMATADAAEAATPATVKERFLALVELAKIAAGDYAASVEDATISDIHEYQDAWGFFATIQSRAAGLATSDDPAVAAVAGKFLALAGDTAPAFGDLQGHGIAQLDASLLFAAAARMELAALSVK